MSFKKYLQEKDELMFPTDEQIDIVANKAEESFWKTVINAFEDKLDDKDFNDKDFVKILESFKDMQRETIKQWLKVNWPGSDNETDKEFDDRRKEKMGTIPSSNADTPATNKMTTSTGGETRGF